MVFRMFTTQSSPIAIDFGSASVKLLQLTAGDEPSLMAAAGLPIPDQIRSQQDQLARYFASELPRILKLGGFKGKRVICAVPSHQTIIQHMQIVPMDGVKRDDQVKLQLQTQLGIHPESVVVRTVEVCEVVREGQTRIELICFAIPRETVMHYVELLQKCRLEVVGVHAEPLAMVRAFDPIHRGDADNDLTTMYIDLGETGTRVAIANGTNIAFARAIQVGGQHFDQVIAAAMKCDTATARKHRLAHSGASWMSIPPSNDQANDQFAGGGDEGLGRLGAAVGQGNMAATASAATTTATNRRATRTIHPSIGRAVPPGDARFELPNVDLSELMDTITDELSMCVRYHRGLFPNRQIDRAILVGGEARQIWLCQHIARSMRLPARLGDPLGEILKTRPSVNTPGLKRDHPTPGWAVPCGLCIAPTDL